MNSFATVASFVDDFEAPPGEKSEAITEDMLMTFSPAMRELRHQIDKVATVDVPVLLLGESGVGKEFVARHLHSRSRRNGHMFLKVNCAALPSELLESELFGYEAGAFTGAVRPKPGQFELCDHGTILLDEIGEMPPGLQAKLLHVLQDQQFSRLGGRRMLTVDVRILAATNVDMEHALQTKRVRADLYYRLNTITLQIPPLRERREDIPLFLRHFMALVSKELGCAPRPFSKRVLEACLRHSWPGNVREIKNFVCRYLVLQDEQSVLSELEAGGIHGGMGSKTAPENRGLKSIVQSLRAGAEKKLIEETLGRTRWNRTEAARLLHISTKTLWNKMRQYGISDPSRQSEVLSDEATRRVPAMAEQRASNAVPCDGSSPDAASRRMAPLGPLPFKKSAAASSGTAAD